MMQEVNFEIIPDQQTPKVPEIDDVELFLRENKFILDQFLVYATTQSNAVGLAANQVSLNGERFMYRVFARRTKFGWELITNPIITEYVGIKELKSEGCLTWKGKAIIAERSRGIRVEFNKLDGTKAIGFFSGFEAQVWQHEINHLNGVEEEVTSDFHYANSLKPIEVGRNEPCPCGSGKKYKSCCQFLK